MPHNLPRKRTFAATSAYESDAENISYATSRSRRQRTSSTTFIETAKEISPPKPIGPAPGTRGVLKPTTSGNVIGSLTTAPKQAVSISKPEPPQPSGIPRSVVPKAKRRLTNTGGSSGTHLKGSSKPLLSTTTKPTPVAPVVVKALKLKESAKDPSHGGLVSAIDMKSSSSKPSPPEKKPASTLKWRSTSSSKKTLESLLSAEQRGHPASQTATRKETQLQRRFPSQQPIQPKRAFTKEESPKEAFAESRPAITDSNGCVHLAPADCELLISFVNSPHYEVWDLGDEANVACPAYLYIMAKDPSRWAGTPLAQPDITLISIECRTKKGPSRFSDRQSELDHWTCSFDGVELPTASGPITPANVSSGTISIEMKWDRVYWMPTTLDGGGQSKQDDINPAPKATSTPRANSLASLLHAGLQERGKGADSRGMDDPRASVPGRGWCMKFWIPVPAQLFLRKETRMFEIEARVHIVPGVDKRTVEVGRDYGFITARSQMTVSHLRSEREMDFSH